METERNYSKKYKMLGIIRLFHLRMKKLGLTRVTCLALASLVERLYDSRKKELGICRVTCLALASLLERL
jgi:hypothetical protein